MFFVCGRMMNTYMTSHILIIGAQMDKQIDLLYSAEMKAYEIILCSPSGKHTILEISY